MCNNASDEVMMKERAKLEKEGILQKLDGKTSDEDDEDNSSSTNNDVKNNRMLRGSMIEGATDEDLEKEKAKLDAIIAEQKKKEEEELLVKKLMGSISSVERVVRSLSMFEHENIHHQAPFLSLSLFKGVFFFF
jgi:hypothetical protein